MIIGRMNNKIKACLWGGFALVWLAIFGGLFAISRGWIGYLPPIEQLQNPIDKYASQLIAANGEIIGSFAHSGTNRVFVEYKDISPNLIKALVATEDVRFDSHSGIDFRGLARAVVKTGILQQKSGGGGSTITQQLAKMLYSPPSSNFFTRMTKKPVEWVIAAKLERYYTKEEIISMYLNQFDFLYNAVGIKSAAYTYFGKTPAELNVEEAAMLVGMCKNPSVYNPVLRRNSPLPLERRNTVFQQMEKAGYLTEREVDSLSKLPIRISFHKMDHKQGTAPYFREHLRKIMMAGKPDPSDYASWQYDRYRDDSIQWETNPLYGWCNKNHKPDGSPYNIYTDGLKIYTTIVPDMQRYAEEAIEEHVGGDLQPAFDRERKSRGGDPFSSSISKEQREAILSRAMRQSERWRLSKEDGLSEAEIKAQFHKKTKMQVWSWRGMRDTIMTPMDSIRYMKGILRSGFMAMDPHNGHVLAYVGDINFGQFQYDMVSDGRRQTGSIIKPYLYSLAMVDGASPCDEILHVQQTYRLDNGQTWTPRNSNSRRIGEMVSIQWGLQNSDNWVTAELMSRTSPITFKRLLESYGLRGPIEATMAMSLGTPEATVGEMVSGYTTFVNDGVRIDPIFVTQIEDMHGNIVATFTPQMTEVLTTDAANKMLYMLQNVVNGGTGGRLRSAAFGLQMPLGGKTGTTQRNSDTWFMGFTPDIVAGCWVGGEERSVRFNTMAFGQGAAAALPVFGKFIKKVYSDSKLGYRKDATFKTPVGFSPCSDAGDVEAVEIFEGEPENITDTPPSTP